MAIPASFDHLGRYAVQRRLGAGGFATVWLAYDEKLDSPVAIKVLADIWADDAAVARRFLEEGRYLRRVESPHVVSVYDAGELDDGRPYLVMTYADQGTLADRLELEDGLEIPQARAVLEDVAAGLQDLHDRDILHRDVKPANVLFRSQRRRGTGGTDVRAIVGDLGLGKALDVSSRLTMIAGSPSYVAPEQAAGEPLDARADQYSLAAVAYRLLAGRPAFTHTSLEAAMHPGVVPPLSGDGRDFPDAVEEVVRRGLAPDPGDRFESVADFASALSGALDRMGAAPVGVAALAGVTPASPTPPGQAQVVPPPRGVTRSLPGGDAVTEAVPEVTGTPAGQSRPSRRRPRGLGTVAAMIAAGALAGVEAYVYAGQEHDRGTVTIQDRAGRISARVPAAWDAYVNGDGWQPPNTSQHFAAVSVGESRRWNTTSADASGLFAGIMPGKQMPEELPGHAGCDAADPKHGTDGAGRSTLRGTYVCGNGVLVEQVVKLAADRVLWVQVRAPGRDTADDVVGSVEVGS